MRSDYTKPQRQSLIGIVVMGMDSLQEVIKSLLPIVAISLFQDKNKRYFWTLGGFALIAAIIQGYLKYLNFTFYIDDEARQFVVREGVFKKTRVEIPLYKIQQVNINQNFIQRLLKVYELQLDTAGSGKTEVTLKAISEKHALALKDRLMADSNDKISRQADNSEADLPKAEPFISVSFLSILKTGITSNYIRSFGLLLAFFISTFQHLDDYLTYSDTKSDFLDEYFNPVILLRFLAVIIFTILFLTLMVNLGRTILRFYNYRVSRQGNTLLLSHGLISTRNSIIRPEKVQMVSVGRNYFQKKFNINDIKIRQASDLEASNDRQKMAMEIPGVNADERDSLLQFLLEKMPERGFAVRPNFRKMIFEAFMYILLPVAGLYGYTLIVPAIDSVLAVVPVYVVFVGMLIYFAFRNSRLFISPDFIIQQRGAWDIDNIIIAPHKIQAIKLHQFFWQRSSDVGTITIYTAGGLLTFGLVNFTILKRLTNYWLYQVETTKKDWM